MASGHFGHLLAVQEQAKGKYLVTMETLDCIHTALGARKFLGNSPELLICVMYIVEELVPAYCKWRFVQRNDFYKISK